MDKNKQWIGIYKGGLTYRKEVTTVPNNSRASRYKYKGFINGANREGRWPESKNLINTKGRRLKDKRIKKPYPLLISLLITGLLLLLSITIINMSYDNDTSPIGDTSDNSEIEPGIYTGLGFSAGTKNEARNTRGSGTTLTCYLGDAATIDGDYIPTEWDDADTYTVPGEIRVYTKHDSTYAYFCVVALMDTTAGDFLDYGYFCWDTAANGGTAPQTDDIQYNCDSQGNFVNYYVGDGSGWDYGTLPSGAQIDAAYDSSEGCVVYECRMPLSELNKNGMFDADGETIGFGVVIYDQTADPFYGLWPDNADSDNPSTWGNTQYSTTTIPEFSHIVVPVLMTFLLVALVRRNKKTS